MWELDNQTPFEAERTWVRDKDGAHQWIVVVKATYDIAEDGTLTLAEEPVEPLLAPEYHGADGESSLRFDADLVGMKPGTDIYLNGIAFSPQGTKQPEVMVSVKINQWRKDLHVFGHRIWDRSMMGGLVTSPPVSFEKVPITYELAYGGLDLEDPDPKKHRMDFRNPVGSGIAYDDNKLIGKPAPQVEVPGEKPVKGQPAGFGAISHGWAPRKDFAGTYDDAWSEHRKPLLPLDYDERYLLCAPQDQQFATYIDGGQVVELNNLTPRGYLRFIIPRHSFQFETYFGSDRKEHAAKLVSVIIESEGPRLILVWQTSLECGNDGEYLDQTLITQVG